MRRQSTNLHAAVASLSADLRWCLTGTPIHNSLEDIGSLIAFAGLVPFDNLMAFRKHIVLPFERDPQSGTKMLQHLLDSICLRRATTLLNLPEIVEIPRELNLAAEEKLQYENTSKLMDQVIKQRASDASGKLNPFGLFQAQLQLRILCNHGTFQKMFSWRRPRDFLLEREDALTTFGGNGEVKCSQCNEITPILSTTRPSRDIQLCGHVLCPECAFHCAGSGGKNDFLSHCGLCQTADFRLARPLVDDRKPCGLEGSFALQGDGYFNIHGLSTKMAAIMADLEEDQFRSKRFVLNPINEVLDIDVKYGSIIFSCWTRSLDLVALHLRRRSVLFARIDGNCELNRRQEMIQSFSTDQNVPILIMTTGKGAFGYTQASPRFGNCRADITL